MTYTQINVSVLEIMQNKYLLIDDSDLVKSSSLYNVLVEEKKEIKRNAKRESTVDARFVIQLNYKGGRSDTLIYYNDSSFYLNNVGLINYDFRVLDSVRKYTNVKCFECKHP